MTNPPVSQPGDVYADYERDPETGEVFVVTKRVVQPDGVDEAFAEHARYIKEAIAMLPDGEHSADVIRAIADGLRKRDATSPDSIAEKARQIALKLKRDADSMFDMPVDDEPIVSQWAEIIAAEFQGGGKID